MCSDLPHVLHPSSVYYCGRSYTGQGLLCASHKCFPQHHACQAYRRLPRVDEPGQNWSLCWEVRVGRGGEWRKLHLLLRPPEGASPQQIGAGSKSDRPASCLELTFSVRWLSSQSSACRTVTSQQGEASLRNPRVKTRPWKCLSVEAETAPYTGYNTQDTHPRTEPAEATLRSSSGRLGSRSELLPSSLQEAPLFSQLSRRL